MRLGNLSVVGRLIVVVAGILTVAGHAYSEESEDSTPPSGQAKRPPKSGYERPDVIGGASSVGTQLVTDDAVMESWVPFSLIRRGVYDFKRRLKEMTGLELNIDYNFLNQYASFSTAEKRGASGSLRFYGRWYPRWAKDDKNSAVIFRFENRHTIASQTPKELGFATGSSLSTAGFKDFGWGTTALYWQQHTEDERLAFSAAQVIGEKWIPFVRAGYSEGDAANLSAMISLGAGWRVKSDDLLGLAATWGRPPESEEGRDQFTVEAFYRFQVTGNVQVTPGFHWHHKPSYNPLKGTVWVASVLRVRIVL